MGSKANASGAGSLLAALDRAKVLTLDTGKAAAKRPRFWNCYACGNRLDRFDRCSFHVATPELRARMVREHCAGALCGCAFCEAVLERESRGVSRGQAIGEVAREFAATLPVEGT